MAKAPKKELDSELPVEYQQFTAELRDMAMASQQGDEKQHIALLNQITPMLRAIVRRHWWGDTFSHEDIVQDILLIVHSKLHTYNPDMPIVPWLRSIAQYRILDCVRQFKRKQERIVPMEDDNVTFSIADTDKDIEDVENMDFVVHALSTLPERQARVVYMLKVQGLTIEEVAQETGMSQSAVKVMAHRAYKSLAKFSQGQLKQGRKNA